MADTKITDLTLATAAKLDEFVINDVTDTSDKKVTAQGILDTMTGDATSSSGAISLATNSVDSAELVDGGVDNSHLAGSIALSKLLTAPEANSTADQTGAEIKTAYEAEANAYTDTKNTKLSGIETLADVTDTTNVNAAAATIVGTIATGTWEGDVVASGFLDSDTMHLGVAQTVTGKKIFGTAGAVGDLAVAGTTSGSTVIDATAAASGVLTLPAATDTLVGKATTDIFTNKSYDLGGTGNVLTGSVSEFNTALQSESFSMIATAETRAAVMTFSSAPVFNDNVKVAFGTNTDSTIVDTGSAMILDFDEANATGKSFDIQSDATSILLLNDSIITAGVPIDVSDIELDTISARDGTLAMSVSGSTVTFAGFLDISDIEVATVSARDGTLSQTISDSTGNVALNGVLDVVDIEQATTSARDGSLAITYADSTGVCTFAAALASPTLTTPDIGIPSAGTLTSCTGLPLAGLVNAAKEETWSFAISDNTTALTTGTKFTWYTPYAITLTDIQASVLTAPTDATLIIDVHTAGSTIMTTDKLDIETTEFHTNDAATQPAITDTTLDAGAKIEFIVDQIGSSVAGAGAIVYFVGYQT